MAVIRLVGVQDAEVAATFPHTGDACVTVRMGKTLLYLHADRTADHFLRAWKEAGKLARLLPVMTSRSVVKSLSGMPDPAVVAHAVGLPPCRITTYKDEKASPFLRVQLGRMMYEVRDQQALASGVAVFREAAELADVVFRSPGDDLIIHGAARTAGDAFFPVASAPALERPRAQAPQRPLRTVRNEAQTRPEQRKAL